MIKAASLMGNVSGGSHMAEVSFDVYNIAIRIQKGDESGWRGDPSASLMFNPFTKRFEVWMIDGQGAPYIACSHDRADHQLIIKLIEGDWQKGKSLHEDILKKNKILKTNLENEEKEKRQELADKLHWALIKDLGHLFGQTKRTISLSVKENLK